MILTSILTTSVVRMIVTALAPKGVEYLQAHSAEAQTNVKLYINEHVPAKWLAQPLEDIVDLTFPIISNELINVLKSGALGNQSITAITNTVVDTVGEECLTAVEQKLTA